MTLPEAPFDDPALTPAGERLLDAASELFYRRGIRAVGVDLVAETAAREEDAVRPVRLEGRAGRALPASPGAALAVLLVPVRAGNRSGRRPRRVRRPCHLAA